MSEMEVTAAQEGDEAGPVYTPRAVDSGLVSQCVQSNCEVGYLPGAVLSLFYTKNIKGNTNSAVTWLPSYYGVCGFVRLVATGGTAAGPFFGPLALTLGSD